MILIRKASFEQRSSDGRGVRNHRHDLFKKRSFVLLVLVHQNTTLVLMFPTCQQAPLLKGVTDIGAGRSIAMDLYGET